MGEPYLFLYSDLTLTSSFSLITNILLAFSRPYSLDTFKSSNVTLSAKDFSMCFLAMMLASLAVAAQGNQVVCSRDVYVASIRERTWEELQKIHFGFERGLGRSSKSSKRSSLQLGIQATPPKEDWLLRRERLSLTHERLRYTQFGDWDNVINLS